MERALLELVLPDLLLDYFDIVSLKELGEISSKQMVFEIHLDEKNLIYDKENQQDYESKGFLPSSTVQDFPIRGKAVYLVIRRRRWRNKIKKQEISNDYSFVAKGSKLTKDISDFLKSTGRDP